MPRLSAVSCNPNRESVHELPEELADCLIRNIAIRIEQLLSTSDVRLGLLHCGNIQEYKRLPKVMICTETTQRAG